MSQPTFQNPPSIYDRPIQEHGGGKYLRRIRPADGVGDPIKVDVYCVIKAFNITCPALQHALKKILACGQRGKGSRVDDIHGVFDAMWRALELARQDEADEAELAAIAADMKRAADDAAAALAEARASVAAITTQVDIRPAYACVHCSHPITADADQCPQCGTDDPAPL